MERQSIPETELDLVPYAGDESELLPATTVPCKASYTEMDSGTSSLYRALETLIQISFRGVRGTCEIDNP